jgi:hypothetical protein
MMREEPASSLEFLPRKGSSPVNSIHDVLRFIIAHLHNLSEADANAALDVIDAHEAAHAPAPEPEPEPEPAVPDADPKDQALLDAPAEIAALKAQLAAAPPAPAPAPAAATPPQGGF